MTATYGIFDDGHVLIEGGFAKWEEARAALAERYEDDGSLDVYEVCPLHPDQPRESCDVCGDEEEDES